MIGKIWWILLGIGLFMFGIYVELMWGCGSIADECPPDMWCHCNPIVGGMFWLLGIMIIASVFFFSIDLEDEK